MKKISYNQGLSTIVAIVIVLIVVAVIVVGIATTKKAPAPEEPILAPLEEPEPFPEELAKEELVQEASCLPSDTPSITVLSPNGGEIFNIGDTMNVEWETCNIPAQIDLVQLVQYPLAGQQGDQIAGLPFACLVSGNQTSLNITIPNQFPSPIQTVCGEGFYSPLTLENKKYKFYVEYTWGPGLIYRETDYSDDFFFIQ